MRLIALMLCSCLLLAASPVTAERRVAASGYHSSLEAYYLVMEAGRDRGIYRAHGLEPQWVTRAGRAVAANDLKLLVAEGTEVGLSSGSEVLLARMQGVPIRIVAGFVGETLVSVYAKADGPIGTPRDLDGRRIGPTSAAVQRQVAHLSRTLGVRAQAVPFASLDQQLGALEKDQIDAIITAEALPLGLVHEGKLRRVLKAADYRPKPELNNLIWASELLIERDPELVGSFVRATLETVGYMKEHPDYAAGLLAKRPGMTEHLAQRIVAAIDWTPSGQPGEDLMAASRNFGRVFLATGAVPEGTELRFEEIVDTRFVRPK